jgi:hypothetical protein
MAARIAWRITGRMAAQAHPLRPPSEVTAKAAAAAAIALRPEAERILEAPGEEDSGLPVVTECPPVGCVRPREEDSGLPVVTKWI